MALTLLTLIWKANRMVPPLIMKTEKNKEKKKMLKFTQLCNF